jgi:hypothetical protein
MLLCATMCTHLLEDLQPIGVGQCLQCFGRSRCGSHGIPPVCIDYCEALCRCWHGPQCICTIKERPQPFAGRLARAPDFQHICCRRDLLTPSGGFVCNVDRKRAGLNSRHCDRVMVQERLQPSNVFDAYTDLIAKVHCTVIPHVIPNVPGDSILLQGKSFLG